MKSSLLLSTLARWLFPVLLVVALYLLYRGHNAPGGGFIGGLVAATAFASVAKGMGIAQARKTLRVEPHTLIVVGMLTALAAGCIALLAGGSFMTGVWGSVLSIPLSNILLFDVSVFLIVTGATLSFFFALEGSAFAEEEPTPTQEEGQ